MPTAAATATKLKPPPIFLAISAAAALRPSSPSAAKRCACSAATPTAAPLTEPRSARPKAGRSREPPLATRRMSALKSSSGVASLTAMLCTPITWLPAGGKSPDEDPTNVHSIAQMGALSSRPSFVCTPSHCAAAEELVRTPNTPHGSFIVMVGGGRTRWANDGWCALESAGGAWRAPATVATRSRRGTGMVHSAPLPLP
eukprot:scaffold3631_cov124-Isochrysis_galbana.AAC.2